MEYSLRLEKYQAKVQKKHPSIHYKRQLSLSVIVDIDNVVVHLDMAVNVFYFFN